MKQNQSLTVMDAGRMTSLEIAQVTGKMHKDVMKAIRNMEPTWLKVNGRNFTLVDNTDSKSVQKLLFPELPWIDVNNCARYQIDIYQRRT